MSETAYAIQDRSGANVVGYVEAVTDGAALGWAWRPGSRDRLSVELHLGEQLVSKSCADVMREDLARSGIGDGRHAFSLAIPASMRSRLNELRVFVVGEGGAPIALDAPPPPAPNADRLADLQRGVDVLIGSQRLMHRNLQAALLQEAPSLKSALADISAAQSALQESIATVELFAVRLEDALARRESPAPTLPAHRGLKVAIIAASASLIGSCWAIYRVMVG